MNVRAEQCLDELIIDYSVLAAQRESIKKAYLLLEEGFSSGNVLYVCGNGGSAADALHIVGELMKAFTIKRPIDKKTKDTLKNEYGEDANGLIDSLQQALPVHALVGSVSLETAFCNDVDDEYGFAQQVYGYGSSNDLLLGISTSGNAKNVVAAMRLARCKGMKTIGLTGGDGGIIRSLCDTTIIVPESVTYKVQELHLPVYHALCRMLELRFFGSDKE